MALGNLTAHGTRGNHTANASSVTATGCTLTSGLTWTEIATILDPGALCRVSVWRAVDGTDLVLAFCASESNANDATHSVSNDATTVTNTYVGGEQRTGSIFIYKVTGADTTTPVGTIETDAFGNQTTISRTLASFDATSRAVLWFSHNDNNRVTPGTDVTELVDEDLDTAPARAVWLGENQTLGDAEISATLPSTIRVAVIAFEINEGAGGSTITLTPDPVATTPAVPAPTLGLGAVTLSPAPVAAALAVPGPTLGLALGLSPAPVSLSLAVPGPTLGLSLALAPSPIATVLAVPAPTLEVTGGTITLAPDPVFVTLALPAPTLGLGAIAIAPSPVAAVLAVPAPTLGLGALSLSPAPIATALVVPAPALALSLALAPDPVATLTVVPASSVSVVGDEITLTPDPVALLLAIPSPSLGLGAIALSPSPVAAQLAVPAPTFASLLTLSPSPIAAQLNVIAPTLGLGALTLAPAPVGVTLVVTVPELDEPIITGSDAALIAELIAYWAEFDSLEGDVQAQRLLLRDWLLAHGGKLVRPRDGLRYIRGGLYPVRV